MSGYSACRNPSLAAVFYRLQLIEAYGTGILKVFESYEAASRQPKIEITPNVFKMILPNLNAPSAKRPDRAPAPHKDAPAPREDAPAPHKDAPAPRKGTPAPREDAAAPRKGMPAPREDAPAPRKGTPAADYPLFLHEEASIYRVHRAPPPQERVMRYALENGSISRREAEKLLGVSQTAAGMLLRKMVESGKLGREGNSRNVLYFPAD
jgi:hypothetical protein